MKKKVLLGLSGGVDSAVAAYQLKQQGYDVTCAFMRNWDAFANQDIQGNPTIHDSICPQEQDYQDAMAVAHALSLPLERVDFIKEYWDDVFTTFLEEYKKGRTPNPDILCNQYIKFHAFLNYAMNKGFDYVATGHYAQIEHKKELSILKKGLDENKDQTYFLAQVPQQALQKALFPIGHMKKQQVREIANALQLTSVMKKKDSTGICFIGERNFQQFLSNYLPMKEGKIIDVDRNCVVGVHSGVLYYTIGQRKGLGIGGTMGPWFVVGKDVYKNELYVSNLQARNWLISTSCIVSHINWMIETKETNFTCHAKFRYRQKDHEVQVQKINDQVAFISYPQGVSSVTSGQEAVFYDQDICLGGGVIEEVFCEGVYIQDAIKEHVSHDKR